jgi:hypothetical protein
MSQLGQDKIVDEYLHQKRNGVFVDIGAYDGVTFSNTLMLERERGWTGICIEPLPDIFAELRKNRGCVCVQACMGNRDEHEVEFLAVQSGAAWSRMLSGVLSEYDPRHLARVDAELNAYGNPCITVENNYNDPAIDEVLRSQGYVLHTPIAWDRFYVYAG